MVDIVNRAEETEAKEGGKDDTVLELTKRIEDLKSTRKKVQSILSLLAAFRQDVQAFQTLFEQRVQPINSDLESLDLDKLDQLPAELPGLRDTMTGIESNEEILVEEQKRLNTELDSAEQEVSVLQGISRVIADLRQKINDIAAEIEAIEQRINEINAKEKQISELDEERFDLFITLLRKTIEMRQFLQNTIDEFEIDKDEMLGRLAFSALIDTGKRTKYVENLAAKVDNRRHSEADLSQKLTPVFTKMDALFADAEQQEEGLSKISELLRDVGLSLKRKGSTAESDFYNVLLKRSFGIGLGIRFDGRNLDDLSMGERAIVLLKILLAHDDKPLLIDQPEEHLDNRYIYNELTPAFRNAKRRRQIIIATHNANLVVNTDAEQIVIAKNSNGILSYTAGPLENPVIRQEIKIILEGGDEAFKKREEKYGYKF